MAHRRTTPALVETAIRGAQDAGRDVVAADVHGGGFVRVYFTDPQSIGNPVKAQNTCDEVFKAEST